MSRNVNIVILCEMCQQGALRSPAPPSLETACIEYRTRFQA